MNSVTTKVFLWTAPRCVSTAFERSIMELPKIKVFHEPFSKPYYFGPEMQSQRYIDQDCDITATYDNTSKMLQSDYEGMEIIFAKDMAYYVDGRFQDFLRKEFSGFQHTFLIRTPKKAVPSLYKASVDDQLTGFSYFDPKEAGYKEMYELYNFISEHFNYSPVVVDADDLLDDPEGIMRSYCQETGLPFDTSMLTWEAMGIQEWNIWKGWHNEAMKSTGFRSRDAAKEKVKRENIDISTFPIDVQSSIEFSMEYYEKLHQHRLKAIQI